MEFVKHYKTINKDSWSGFVKNHLCGNIFYTPEMVNVYEKTRNYSPCVVFAFENKEIVGIIVGVIQKEYSGFLGFLSSRCIVFGGPLVKHDNPKIVDMLLKEHNRHVKKKTIYTQFRNIFDIKHHKTIFEKNGFNYEPHLDIYIDLTQNLDEFWKSLKSKLRQNIRKSIKHNLSFDEIKSEEELREGYTILKIVYQNAKLPIPDFSLFLNSNRYIPDNVKFFKASLGDEIIGVRFVLLFNGLVYDWYAGSKNEYYKFYPNDFLPYKTIEWAMMNHDYKKFDFGGAGKPNMPYGVRDHKLKFSDNLVEPGRYEKIHHPFIYKLAKIGFEVWKKIH